jgi:AcrR family transcriptional regulator
MVANKPAARTDALDERSASDIPRAESSRPGASTRRTTGVHVKGRAEDVVRRVLDATVAELGRVGYASLRIEAIAASAGVHKTSVYRRWPTREALVAAALERENAEAPVHDTGDLRSDLLASLRDLRALKTSPRAAGILRMVQLERGNTEVDRIIRGLRTVNQQRRRAPIERAIQRGELPAGTDAGIVSDLVHMPLVLRIVSMGESVSDEYLEQLVDVALAGARATFAPPDAPAAPRR